MGWSSRFFAGVLIILATRANAQDGSGLVFSEGSWGLWKPWSQSRTQPPALQSNTRLVRDFSLTSLSPAIPDGVRLTGGFTWGNTTVLSSPDNLANTPTRIDERLWNPNVQANVENRTTAFVGLGYSSGLLLDSNWRLNADLGITMNLPPGIKIGNSPSAIEDALRDVRVGPLMQLRLSYSF